MWDEPNCVGGGGGGGERGEARCDGARGGGGVDKSPEVCFVRDRSPIGGFSIIIIELNSRNNTPPPPPPEIARVRAAISL